MTLDATLLKQSWLLSSRRAPDLVARFYAQLSWKYPSARRMLERLLGADADAAERLAFIAGMLVEHIDDPKGVGIAVAALGGTRKNVEVPTHVATWMQDVLIDTLEAAAGDHWTVEMRAAWIVACGEISARVSALAARRLSSS